MPAVRMPAWCKTLRQPYRYKVIYGGRGSGKSRNIASELVQQAAMRPMRILCCREIQRSINDSVKRMLDDRIRELEYLNLIKTGTFRSTKNEITTAFGSTFFFRGLRSNAESLKSIEGVDICWVEEAQTISRESLDLLIPTIREGITLKENPEIWFTLNPRYKTDPIYTDFLDTEEPRPGSKLIKVNWMNNPWFPRVLEEERLYDLNRDRDKYNHIWEGEILEHDDAKVFKHITDWEIGEVPDAPKGTIVRYGADFGEGKSDPSTLVRNWLDHDKRIRYIDREYRGIGIEYHILVREYKKVMAEEKNEVIICDSSRPGVIKWLKRGGLCAVGAKKGAGSIHDGLEFIKSYKTIIHPRCKHTIDEFQHYKYKINKQTEEILNTPEDKNNHMIDALRYSNEPEMHASRNRVQILKQ